ncbi:MAG TPA: rhodanese-like domain-containing protein, partial [Ardenticatenaceae bacterium]|nr:rhodanese-like domain-containing protein [Ardenticatenaceae bacterium]
GEEEFVGMVLAGQPEAPAYFAVMKRVNKEGPALLGVPREPAILPPAALHDALERQAQVVDTRPSEEYAAGFVPGTINIPYNSSFLTWAGALLDYTRPLFLIAAREQSAEIVADLRRIDLDRVEGVFDLDAIHDWAARYGRLETIPQVTVNQLDELLDDGRVALLDVRGASEYAEGRIPGVPNVPLATLPRQLGQIPPGRPVAVHCRTGARSAIAASLLRAAGVPQAINVIGGISAWKAAGKPVEDGDGGQGG